MVYVTDQPNSGGYTVVPFDLNNDLYGENAHKATSIHPQLSVRNLVNSLGNDATIFVRNENRFNEIAGVLSDNPPTLLANNKSVDGIVSQSGTESQAQNSAAMPASALETDEAYFSVAEKYRDGTATEAETEQLLSGSDILSELYRQNASLAERVQLRVSEFFAKLRQNIGKGARSKEVAWMSDAMDELQEKWEAALRVAAENQIKLNSADGTKNTATEGGEVQYSIATSLKDDLQSVFDNKFDSESSEVLIGETSDFLVNEIGVKPLPNYMPANKAYSAMATEEKAISDGKPIGEKYHYHGLGVNGLFDLLEKSENPVAAYAAEPTELDGRFDRLVLVTDKEINGGLGIVVVEVDSTARQGKKQIEANKTITSYDKQSAIVAVQKAFDENRLLYVNKKSGTAFDSGRKGSNSPTTISETVRKNNIQQFWANVNWAKYAKNTKSRVFTSGDTSGTAMADAFIKAGYGQNSAVLPASALDIGDAEQLTGETGSRKSVALSLGALDVDLSKLTDEDILNSLSSDGKLTKKGKLLMIDIDTQKEFIDIYQKRLDGVNRRLASFPHVKANADEVAELEQRRKQYQEKIAQKQNTIEADAEKKTGISAMSKRQLQAKIRQLEKQVKQAREQTKRTAAKREARLKNIDASSVIHSVADTIANERTLSRYAKSRTAPAL